MLQRWMFINMASLVSEAHLPIIKEENFLSAFFTGIAQCSFDKAKDAAVSVKYKILPESIWPAYCQVLSVLI